MSKAGFIKGTLLLSATGLLTRLIGFFYRIFLSHTIGAQGLGIYQLILPTQALVLAITTTGIQMAISRLCAGRFAVKKEQEACEYFLLGTSFSLILTIFLSYFLYQWSDFFAVQIIKEAHTKDLLRILAFSLPLSSLHTCISGYYFAKKDTRLPAFLQLWEQIVRTGITMLLYQIFLAENREVTAMIAVLGSLAGEIASSLFGVLFLGIHFHSKKLHLFSAKNIKSYSRNLFSMALPLSLNRLLLTLLASIEVMLIPQQLHKYGLSASEALSVYGIFSGMVLPLILFPSTITGAVSSLLMPSVAGLQALGYRKRIRYVTIRVCSLTFLMGLICCIGFFLSGKMLGTFMFHNEFAGEYIRSMSFLCPFLYLHTTLSSILHGLGRSGVCLVHNLIGACIRLGFVIFSIPQLGIRGYLYGLLVCELFLTGLHMFDLQGQLMPETHLGTD